MKTNKDGTVSCPQYGDPKHDCLAPTPEATHTPTPWIVRPQELDETMRQIRYESPDGLASVIATTHNATICEEHGGDARINAAFIVNAVNYHEELLEAARGARNVLAALIVGDLKSVRADSVALAQLRQAIAKAEGK